MAKKTPEEIEALKHAAAQKKEAARLAAEQKAAGEKAEAESVAAEQKAAGDKKEVPALFIKSVPESFRRCGRRFTREGYGIALDILTDDEIQRLKDEPNLFVEEVEALIDNVEH